MQRDVVSFSLKTRKGGVAKVTREHYIRADVKCPRFDETSIKTYLLPDAHIIYDYFDLLVSPVCTHVLFLTSVLNRYRSLCSPEYYRCLLAKIKDPAHHFHVCEDEHNAYTRVVRRPLEPKEQLGLRQMGSYAAWVAQQNVECRFVCVVSEGGGIGGAVETVANVEW